MGVAGMNDAKVFAGFDAVNDGDPLGIGQGAVNHGGVFDKMKADGRADISDVAVAG